MSVYSWLGALRGAAVWKKKTDSVLLTLVIPGYEEELMSELPSALRSFLSLGKRESEQVRVVYSDRLTKDALRDSELNFAFVRLSEREMRDLLCYILATMKHYGHPRRPNVKLVSFRWLYGGQLRMIADSKICLTRGLITEMILNRE